MQENLILTVDPLSRKNCWHDLLLYVYLRVPHATIFPTSKSLKNPKHISEKNEKVPKITKIPEKSQKSLEKSQKS